MNASIRSKQNEAPSRTTVRLCNSEAYLKQIVMRLTTSLT